MAVRGLKPGKVLLVGEAMGLFTAGVLSSLMEGNALPEAAERGCAIGAIQTQSVSDNEGLPDVEELLRFMTSHDSVNGFA